MAAPIEQYPKRSDIRLSASEAALYGPRVDTAALADATALLACSLDELSQRLADCRQACRVITDELGYTVEALAAVRAVLGGAR